MGTVIIIIIIMALIIKAVATTLVISDLRIHIFTKG